MRHPVVLRRGWHASAAARGAARWAVACRSVAPVRTTGLLLRPRLLPVRRVRRLLLSGQVRWGRLRRVAPGRVLLLHACAGAKPSSEPYMPTCPIANSTSTA